MSSSQIMYEQLKNLRETAIGSILKPVTLVEPNTSISKTVDMMTETNSYDVFTQHGKEVTTANARDILNSKNIANDISSLMYKTRALTRNDTVGSAATLISHYRTRSVPVAEDGQIVGQVFAKDIVSLLGQQNLHWIAANTVLIPNPTTVKTSEPLAAARKLMMSMRIDHLPVIRSGKISQVLTSMHLLQALKPRERIGSDLRGLNILRRFDSPIGNLGSTRVPNCITSSPLSTVIDSIIKADSTCCLLTLWDELHGIITYKDLVNLLETRLESEVPLYIIGLPHDMANANIVKAKLDKIIRNLRKAYPEVEEAKASIKTVHNPSSNRNHYQVVVRIITPYQRHSYTELGWDLSKIFDTLGSRIIRNLSKRSKKRWKTSIRKLDKKDIF
ncbi:MAG: CBS domain-containing protein [Thaumarchaeota archaeon]|nr:CBS domain-containing protein [Nitrososphaerota archaeon]